MPTEVRASEPTLCFTRNAKSSAASSARKTSWGVSPPPMTSANLWRVVKASQLLDPTEALGTSSSIVRNTDILQVCAVVASRESQLGTQRIHMNVRFDHWPSILSHASGDALDALNPLNAQRA